LIGLRALLPPRHQPLEFRNPLLRVGRIQRAQLQLQKRRETGGDLGMKLAAINVGDQPTHRVPHMPHAIQRRQRIGAVWKDDSVGRRETLDLP
jgi:hypothetical protein